MNSEKGLTSTNQHLINQPNDFNSERMLLGQLLYSGSLGNRELDKIMSNIESLVLAANLSQHFYNPIHKITYDLIYSNFCKQRPISPSIFSSIICQEAYFQNDKAVAEMYLDGLVKDACMPSQIYEITKFIIDLSVKRQIVLLTNNLADEIGSGKNSLWYDELIQDLEKNLASLMVHQTYTHGSETLDDVGKRVLEQIQINRTNKNQITGLSTGYFQLDKMLAGFHNSDLVIIAARPAMGKTSFALCLALNIAENMRDRKEKIKDSNEIDNKIGAVGFVSLEMSGEQLVNRLISVKSGINAMKLRTGNLTDDEFASVNLAANNLRTLDFVIDDTAAISIVELRSKARRMVINHKLKILFVDYLQLLHGAKKSSDANRVSEISEISRGLKQIAKELNIPVIALSQLSRDVEKRQDKIPRLSDLRESGSIEQDADIVMFIHREEYYLKSQKPSIEGSDISSSEDTTYSNTTTKEKNFDELMENWQDKMDKALNHASIIIAKHRSGPVGEVDLRFDHDTTAFLDPNKYAEDPDFLDKPFEN